MSKIILLRHPQTTWNQKIKLQGWKEGKITPKGRFQALIYLKKFQAKVTRIYCADNHRTQFLANLLSKNLSLPFNITPLLREKGFGIFEGKRAYQISRLVNWDSLTLDQKYKRIPQNGESLQQVGQRAKKFLNEICADLPEKDCVIMVTSGALIRSLLVELDLIKKADIYNIKIGNCSETILEYKSGIFTLVKSEKKTGILERVI